MRCLHNFFSLHNTICKPCVDITASCVRIVFHKYLSCRSLSLISVHQSLCISVDSILMFNRPNPLSGPGIGKRVGFETISVRLIRILLRNEFVLILIIKYQN